MSPSTLGTGEREVKPASRAQLDEPGRSEVGVEGQGLADPKRAHESEPQRFFVEIVAGRHPRNPEGAVDEEHPAYTP